MRTISSNLIVSILGAALLLVACGERSASEALSTAKASLSKGDSKSAIIELKVALQQEPGSGEARFLMGKALLVGGDAELANVELRKALDLKYPSAKVIPPLARAMLARQQFQALVDEFATVDLGEPAAIADLMTSLGAAYDALGQVEKSQSAIRAALQAVPDSPATLLLQARLSAVAGRFDQALALIDKVIVATPADAEAWFANGVILLRGKADAAGAIEAFSKAVSFKPDHVLARSSLISLLLAKPDVKAASAQLDRLRKIVPKSPEILFFDAQLALLNGKPKVALQLIDQVLKTAPANAYALEMAGAIQLANGMLPQAQRSLSRALDLLPNLPVARQRLAQTYLMMGQPAHALKTLEPLLSGNDANAGAYALAGEAHFQARELDLANANFANAVRLDPANAMTRTSLALTKLRSAGVDATVKELRAIAASDKGTTADTALVGLLARLKDFAGALAAVDAIDKKLPKSAVAAGLRGEVYLLGKDLGAARSSYERALEFDPMHVPSASMLAALDLADRKPEVARRRFETILATDPSNYQATLEMAKMLVVAKGPNADIARLLTVAIKLRPTEEEPRLLLIQQLLEKKKANDALTLANDSAAAVPDSSKLLDALGRALVANGDTNQAINSFSKLTSLQPGSPVPYLHLSAAYLAAKNKTAAEKSLRQALTITPDYLPAQRALIQLMILGKRQDEALIISRKVQSQRPGSDVGFMMESEIEVSRNNVAAAVEVYRKALKQLPLTTVAVKLHSVLAAARDKPAADKMAATWIAEHPKDVDFLFYLGDSAMAQGNFEIAQKHFRSVIAIEPGNFAALNNIAWTMAKLGQPGAVSYAEQAVKLRPNTAGVMDTLALALASEKQVEKALDVQKQALALAVPPVDQIMRLNLAKLYLQAGDKAAARTELQTLAKLGDSFSAHSEVSRLLKSI